MGLFSKKKKKHDVEWIDMRMIEIKLNCPRVHQILCLRLLRKYQIAILRHIRESTRKKKRRVHPVTVTKRLFQQKM